MDPSSFFDLEIGKIGAEPVRDFCGARRHCEGKRKSPPFLVDCDAFQFQIGRAEWGPAVSF